MAWYSSLGDDTKGVFMIERDYYSIAEAAEIVGRSARDLLHFGANEKIQLFLHPSNIDFSDGLLILESRNGTSSIIQTKPIFLKELLLLESSICLQLEETNQRIYVNHLFFEEERGNKYFYTRASNQAFCISIINLYLKSSCVESLKKRSNSTSALTTQNYYGQAEEQQKAHAEAEENTFTQKQRETLLKQIGVLALVLAENSEDYRIGGSPNANAIAKKVQDIIDAWSARDEIYKKGTSRSSIAGNIRDGIALMPKYN